MEELKIELANNVLNRIKALFGIKTDFDLASFLGVSQPRLAQWRKRGTLDITAIITKCDNIDWNYLIKGETPGATLGEPKANYLIGKTKPQANDEIQKLTTEIDILKRMLREKDEIIIELKLLERRRSATKSVEYAFKG